MELFLLYLTVFLSGVVFATSHKIPFSKPFPRYHIMDVNTGLGIAGGTPAQIKSFPYQASIFDNNNLLLGSGTIVGKKFILTSAFLVNSYTKLQVRVGSGETSKGGQLIDVKKIIPHEKFDYFYSYDVALLVLSKDIKFGKSVKPIKLASKEPKNGTTSTVSGYGDASFTSKIQARNVHSLQKGEQNVVDRDACQPYYTGIITLDESNFCAYNPSVCPCYFDIGDPLVQENKLIGYFLGGSFCCRDLTPQIYNDVSNIRKWVKKHMKREGNGKENYGYYYSE